LKIYFNPEKLLKDAGAGWVWEITFLIILIGLTISFVVEVFKIQKKEKPDFWGVLWKTAIIILLYRFLPETIEQTVEYISKTVDSGALDNEFYKVFTTINFNLNQSIISENIPESCPVNQKITIMNAEISYLSGFIFQYIQKLAVFFALISIWVVKEIIFSWAWPVLMSINMIGLCSALVIPSFPGQGFGSVGSFFKSLTSISLWPVIYSTYIFICEKPLINMLKITGESLKCPTVFESGRDYVTTLSGLIFMVLMIGLTPFFSKKLIDHEGVRLATLSCVSGFGAVLTFSGTGINNKVETSNMISNLGNQMIKSGNLMTEYVHKYKNTNEYNDINIGHKERSVEKLSTTQTNLNIARDLISSEKQIKKKELK